MVTSVLSQIFDILSNFAAIPIDYRKSFWYNIQ